jgi:hypothetical protein
VSSFARGLFSCDEVMAWRLLAGSSMERKCS